METLRITTGEIHLAINGDENRVIVFNPKDVLFAEKFYTLMGDFQQRLTEYQKRGERLDAVKEKDENNAPINAGERIALQIELCTFMREKIDYLFGVGTSQKAFGDALDPDVFQQFFTGITPYVQNARAEKIAQYTTPASMKRHKRK